MTMRALDIEKKSTGTSKGQRIEVDEWAGSFQGQARRKVEIAISGYLERVRQSLVEAQDLTDGLLGRARSEGAWESGHTAKSLAAENRLKQADEVIGELKSLSASTPYAYIGLQLVDVSVGHIAPARHHLSIGGPAATATPQRVRSFEQAAFHIARAIEQLDRLAGRFESERKARQMEESVKRLAKMHQSFVEDMQIMLGACEPLLNPRAGKWKILPDDVAEKMLEALRQRDERKKSLKVTLSAAPTGANRKLRYALNAPVPNACPGPDAGARGNLRDSDDTVAYHKDASGKPYELHNWAVHFEVDVP
jgi:hypothetical protein